MYMSIKHVEASILRWKSVSKEDRTNYMKGALQARWRNASDEYRKAVGKKLAEARKLKK